MKISKILLIFLVFASCNAPQAVYDYDEQANFSSYTTYGIYPELRTGLSQLDERRLIESVERFMRQKKLKPSEDPNLELNIYSEEYRKESDSRLGIGVGGTGRNVGIGVSGGIPIGGAETYLRLTFDLIDTRSNSLVWQAVVESIFDLNASPEVRQQKFDAIVEKALKAYPPKK